MSRRQIASVHVGTYWCTRLGDDVQGAPQLVGMLEVQLERENWGALMHLMHLCSFMARCKPYMATQLANAGGARVLLGACALARLSM